MSGKYCNHLWILIIAICVSPMQMAVGQTGPGGGYAKIPKGAYSIIAVIRAKPGKRGGSFRHQLLLGRQSPSPTSEGDLWD